ncbi:MAG: hypothetical protein WDM78_13935 [Puia sp.]
MNLPISYNKNLFKQFEINELPFLVIVDDKGMVRAVTYEVDKKQMDTFLLGGNPTLSLHASAFFRHNKIMYFDRENLFWLTEMAAIKISFYIVPC